MHTNVQSQRATAHPNYGELNNVRINDVGVIFLDQPVAFSSNIFPIFLLPVSAEAEHPLTNVQGMVLGFAGSQTSGQEGLENLQGGHIRAMAHQACLGLYATADAIQHFCGDDPEERSNFCLGDQVINFLFGFIKSHPFKLFHNRVAHLQSSAEA